MRRDEAERLLTGGHDAAHPELSRLLAAAAAPPQPHELTGLDAALAAFEQAGRVEQRVSAPRRRRVLRPLAAVAAVSGLLVGGVAVAAETGYLPGTDPPPSRQSLDSREAPPASTRTSPGRGSGPVGTPAPSATSPPAATRDMAKLCKSWEQAREKGKKPMKPEDLRELASAAGGEDRIPGFCAPLLQPPGRRSATPTPSRTHPSPSHPNPPGASDRPGNDRGNQRDGGPAG
ncbi:hypothetical protein [Phytohabitans houttuyneae]|uniref:Uncharacterized protein n=1 Tax=Phytohabitans houttuyneae TaxID=1076126 RepID=A0A6V8KFY2_9ACTN|nr:hypothetical protein [Phytohabitans houttuyneae]GFJ79635.1 hypothetical protein Phou_038150 [Phytohabitans houttuyneae]